MRRRVLTKFGMALGLFTLCLASAVAQPTCSVQTTNPSDFNGTPIETGNYIWFNANFTASGIPATGATIFFQNSNIQFTADQSYNLPVPNAQITFDPLATCTATTFDTVSNTWITTVPVSGDDEIFLTGLAFPVPAGFATAGGKIKGNVTWQGVFGVNSSSNTISIGWKWGAAVYSTFSADYNALQIKPSHNNSCAFNNSDHAGTPEGISSSGISFKKFVIGGARGGGGSNFTGSWSSTANLQLPSCSGIGPE